MTPHPQKKPSKGLGPSDDPSATLVWTPRPGSRATCQVGRRIGAGGFAEVFEAELHRPGQPPQRVALKRLLPGMRGDPLRQRQLRREALIGSSLNHPNIAKVLTLVDLGDEVALAMELVEGMQCNHLLHRLLRRGRELRIEAIAHITAGLFAALKYLEKPLGAGRPLVHADISLENLMVTTAGAVKLIDFGIAAEDGKAGEPGPDITERSTEQTLTRLHQVAGKRPYLPPEGMPADGPSSQSDLYAAGVCFWELCTGRRFPVLPPGVGGRELGSLIAFAAEGLPEPAWRLLKNCLALDPAERIGTADEGLTLCRRLAEGAAAAEVAGALGELVRLLPATGEGRPMEGLAATVVEGQDYFLNLLRRLHGAFCADRVLALAPVEAEVSDDGDEPAGPPTAFTLKAAFGSPLLDGALPDVPLLVEALEGGACEAPDGALLFRIRPPSEAGEARPHVFAVQPAPGCVYDPLAQAVLKNLLSPSARQ